MSCSPVELSRKAEEFLSKWQLCKNNPGIDGFVEFAVAVSSFTEFLDARGLPGLHQLARAVEQHVLSQFDRWNSDPVPPAPLDDLDTRITELSGRINAFLAENSEENPERRLHEDSDVAPGDSLRGGESTARTARVWLPAASIMNVTGSVHAVNVVAPSSLHS